MKKKILVTSIVLASSLYGAGWKLPEQSAKSTALSGANVANAHNADAAYYNPANMSFQNKNAFSIDMINVALDAAEYSGTYTNLFGTSVPVNAEAEKENKLVPAIFYTVEADDGVNYGLSVVVPGGLSKRWEKEAVSRAHAEEFTLQILEINPSFSFKLSENVAFGGGIRLISSEGTVKSNGYTQVAKQGVAISPLAPTITAPADGYSAVSRDMEGSSVDYGYNIALAYQPSKELNVAFTYRSNVDLTIKGDAKLSASAITYLSDPTLSTPLDAATAGTYDGVGAVTVPLPATTTLASSYDFGGTVVEALYEITHWSEYKALDFEYAGSPTGSDTVLKSAFDNPKARNWDDTTAIRLGVTHQYNKDLVLMAGYATDEAPSQKDKTSFESPSADGYLYSFGGSYRYSKDLILSGAYLKTVREDKKVSSTVASDNASGLNGAFSNTDATLISLGIEYLF